MTASLLLAVTLARRDTSTRSQIPQCVSAVNENQGQIPVTEPSRAGFFSYASQGAGVDNVVVDALECRGLEYWIAPRDGMPGALYVDPIVRAIDAVKAIVFVLSQSAAASRHVLSAVERLAE